MKLFHRAAALALASLLSAPLAALAAGRTVVRSEPSPRTGPVPAKLSGNRHAKKVPALRRSQKVRSTDDLEMPQLG